MAERAPSMTADEVAVRVQALYEAVQQAAVSAPDAARAISLTVLPDGSARLEVGDESIVVNSVELDRLKAALTQKPTKRGKL